ncbi:MAG: hypothetical protein ABI779_15765 [Acidobacteriota bacterium]
MRILSKSTVRATAIALAFFSVACARLAPWRKEPVGEEVNFAFTLQGNLIALETLRIDDRTGKFLLGSAAPRTVVDPRFTLSQGDRHALQFGEKQTVRLYPSSQDLHGVADAIIGVEAWQNRAISIDYRSGLVTYQKGGIRPGLMDLYPYQVEPRINVLVDGRTVAAIVDTTSPDTLVLPGPTRERRSARITIGGTDFGTIDVQYAPVTEARVGNRLLSRFLVTIDYGQKVVGLWRDPRIPL